MIDCARKASVAALGENSVANLLQTTQKARLAKKERYQEPHNFLIPIALQKSGRQDLNLRPRDPQSRALAKLRHAPRKRQYSNKTEIVKQTFFRQQILRILHQVRRLRLFAAVLHTVH